MGMRSLPPSESFANSSSHCFLLSAETESEKLSPIFGSGPKSRDVSVPISTLAPIGSDMCMMRSFGEGEHESELTAEDLAIKLEYFPAIAVKRQIGFKMHEKLLRNREGL